MNSRIENYLDDLQSAMKDLDRATVRDALADSEDHLTAAFSAESGAHPELSPDEIAEAVIEQYGSPMEIRDVYADIESHTTPVFAGKPSASGGGFRGFFGVVGQPGAWAACLYMVLALVTGNFFFTWAVTGFSLSLGLIPLIIGLPFTMLFFLSVRGLGFVEGRLVEALLGVRMPRRSVMPGGGSWWEKFKTLMSTRTTWTTFLYMILMMPLGVFYFGFITGFLGAGIGFIGAPVIQYVFHQPLIEPDVWIPFYAMPFVMAAGALLVVLTLHIARGLMLLHGRLAKAMLVN